MVRRQAKRPGELGERYVPGTVAIALVQPHEPEYAGVDHGATQAQALPLKRRPQEVTLDRGNMDDGDPARHRCQQRVDCEVERRRRGEVGGAHSVHADRGLADRTPWSRPPLNGGLQLNAAVLDR